MEKSQRDKEGKIAFGGKYGEMREKKMRGKKEDKNEKKQEKHKISEGIL